MINPETSEFHFHSQVTTYSI